jgi:hypothetical protein
VNKKVNNSWLYVEFRSSPVYQMNWSELENKWFVELVGVGLSAFREFNQAKWA